MKTLLEVDLGEIVALGELVDDFINQRKWVNIFDGNVVEGSVVYA